MAESNPPPRYVANKSSWGVTGFEPGKTVILSTPLNLKLTKEQAELAVRGFIPEAMEDKWFIYFDPDDDAFYFHRSWTGFLVYKVTAQRSDDEGMLLTHIETHRDANDGYRVSSEYRDKEAFEMVRSLIGYKLLNDCPNFVCEEWLASFEEIKTKKKMSIFKCFR
ncbi:uncharacterized protein LOC110849878 [Folsomia candida]|uniref:uncharacterized protein LOC110849878 n=1 Tax=Folsomia candida TaxID=158441 RepID=UPI000B902373|nr:uncharacterized protein LOC110849878 [Folsomia candida]